MKTYKVTYTDVDSMSRNRNIEADHAIIDNTETYSAVSFYEGPLSEYNLVMFFGDVSTIEIIKKGDDK